MMETLPMGLTAFAGMVLLVWFLPGLVCRKGSFPEDFPPKRNRGDAAASAAAAGAAGR